MFVDFSVTENSKLDKQGSTAILDVHLVIGSTLLGKLWCRASGHFSTNIKFSPKRAVHKFTYKITVTHTSSIQAFSKRCGALGERLRKGVHVRWVHGHNQL